MNDIVKNRAIKTRPVLKQNMVALKLVLIDSDE